MAYSHSFEQEVDDYALKYLQDHHISTQHFADLMIRIEQEMIKKDPAEDKKWQSYISTHPLTKERIQRFDID